MNAVTVLSHSWGRLWINLVQVEIDLASCNLDSVQIQKLRKNIWTSEDAVRMQFDQSLTAWRQHYKDAYELIPSWGAF